MIGIWAVLFVMVCTILGKWLLFDDDAPDEVAADSLRLHIADDSQTPPKPPISRSA